MSSKPTCLIVASAASQGVSARSFHQAFCLCSSVFNLQTATPGGKPIDFVGVDETTARWVQDFSQKSFATPAKLESIDETVCAIGQGVSGLCCAVEGQRWIFTGYSLTGPSVFELVRSPDFANLPLIVEDFVKDSGGSYTASQEDAVHVVIDRHLVTGQNMQSTSVAVNNLIMLCNGK
ncbi:glutamine amidotransferase-like class 1 domain-containing protein 1 isoform X2 [Salvelinus fontinalis]|uniref:glutamine amidotransferase-like class 1 domain-containing protein 1 isoform X2 n=1 Tax=Salvelinus fontinalis TaxID=8038 RepID=UPI00248539AC|nr:glutamine amidotransferase-like class 1 domain-containing protein 1 isoform X2 [Salvelinus fontinalis]